MLCGPFHCYKESFDFEIFFPLLLESLRDVWVVFEAHATRASVAIRNSIVSASGAIREAHPATVWAMRLKKISNFESDVSATIKRYNDMASANANLFGIDELRSLLF